MEFRTAEDVKKAVDVNLGIYIISNCVTERELAVARIKAIPLSSVNLKRDFCIVYRRNRCLSEADRAFLGLRQHSYCMSIMNGNKIPLSGHAAVAP